MSESCEELIAYCRSDGRICPQPMSWHALWGILTDVAQEEGLALPSLPLILGGWSAFDWQKRDRLKEHLAWADEAGCLSVAAEFLNPFTCLRGSYSSGDVSGCSTGGSETVGSCLSSSAFLASKARSLSSCSSVMSPSSTWAAVVIGHPR